MPTNFRHLLQSVPPALSPSSHKGQGGRVTVIGGCKQYTGAPYFAAMTTMKLGIDLTTIYCTRDAGIPIKSYSPDLMVDPILYTQDTVKGLRDGEDKRTIDTVESMVSRCNSIIIGCGLGKDPLVQQQITEFIQYAVKHQIPIVIDGDGLTVINDKPDLIKNYKQCILTPNAMEFHRLYKAVFPHSTDPPMNVEITDELQNKYIKQNSKVDGDFIDNNSTTAKHTSQLANALGNITIVRKGQIDLITNGKQTVFCCARGGLKRVGGQGDVTAGTVGTHLAWQHLKLQQSQPSNSNTTEQINDEIDSVVLAGLGGCLFTRLCSRQAFAEHGRSMLTTNLIEKMQPIVRELYPFIDSKM